MVDDQEMPRAVEFLISQVLEPSALRPELFGIVFDLLFELKFYYDCKCMAGGCSRIRRFPTRVTSVSAGWSKVPPQK